MKAQSAGKAILIASLANLVASVALLTVLKPGTIAGGAVTERMVYVAAHQIRWTLGWASCIGGTLTLILLFYAIVTWANPKQSWEGYLPFLLVLVGAISDTMGASLQIFALPKLAVEQVQPFAAALFVLFDNLTTAWTGFLNNFWYGLGFLTLVPLLRRSRLPRRFATGSSLLGPITLFWSLASFLGQPGLLVGLTAITMVLFIVWSFDLGFYLIRHPDVANG